MPRGRPRGSTSAVDSNGQKIKGVMTAYACFVKTCREEHKKLHPDENVQFGEFAAQCSQRWKTMSDKEKEKFHEMAVEDKERYDDEMKDFVPPPGTTATGRRRRRRGAKKERDPNKPKRALSAFFYYAADERTNVKSLNPDFSVGEIAKELGRQWNELNEEQKSPYEKQAESDRARYDVQIKIYRSGGEVPPPPAKKVKENNGHAAPVEVDLDEEEEDASED